MNFTPKTSLFTRSFTSLLLAAALASGGASMAADKPHRDPVAKMAEHLSLDASQKTSVAAIFERGRPAQDALRERSRTHFKALKALDPKSRDYTSRSQALADEAGTLARDRVLQRTQLGAELSTVLTAEQMSKFRDQRGKHRQRGGKHCEDGADTAS
ncbi:MAG: Spy/CpxP family protein refolding chaperone [Panacagrimonas sp.]